MRPSLVRRQMGNLIPPKITTQKLVLASSGEGLAPLVNFYSRLPKGPAPSQAKYFNGKNASAAPAVWVILRNSNETLMLLCATHISFLL
ncbi:hypothetical protein F5J12DRAFT_725871 [Pisolithus orientalis]|uniref:uncharacterized protein n=1 Tax=Pisolithus orientalis TaxID=936130 RepID=UPI002223F5C5|nr:uncharacterized protein F5J12DRAFT_725871 [Pisolithus orientalis]KAI5996028.1 hypothetical protein F5J12DRAFT_725871 [Pisolithus orientalis]